MTMPTMMNCAHKAYSWCLDCVAALGEERERLRAALADAELRRLDLAAPESPAATRANDVSTHSALQWCTNAGCPVCSADMSKKAETVDKWVAVPRSMVEALIASFDPCEPEYAAELRALLRGGR